MESNSRKPATRRRLDCIVGRPWKYMHTMGGMPAHYYPGEQICFALRTRPIPLCDTLEQIKREQEASSRWRVKRGFLAGRDYGWMKVQSPNTKLSGGGPLSNETTEAESRRPLE